MTWLYFFGASHSSFSCSAALFVMRTQKERKRSRKQLAHNRGQLNSYDFSFCCLFFFVRLYIWLCFTRFTQVDYTSIDTVSLFNFNVYPVYFLCSCKSHFSWKWIFYSLQTHWINWSVRLWRERKSSCLAFSSQVERERSNICCISLFCFFFSFFFVPGRVLLDELRLCGRVQVNFSQVTNTQVCRVQVIFTWPCECIKKKRGERKKLTPLALLHSFRVFFHVNV